MLKNETNYWLNCLSGKSNCFVCELSIFLILSTAGGRQSGDPTGDNQLTSLIAVVRSANENKC